MCIQNKFPVYIIGTTSFGDKLHRALWNVAYIFLFRPFITPFFRRWRNFILCAFGAKISSTSLVYASARIWAPWNLALGDNSCIGPHAEIYNVALVKIGSNSIISQHVFICTASHKTDNISKVPADLISSTVAIGDNVWVALGAYINMGCCIGDGAIVGAKACVFNSIKSWTIVGGNPAEFLKIRNID